MARSKSLGKKRPEPESNPASPAQPGSQAGVPSTSGRENLVPDPNIQTRARPRHRNPPDVEWYTSPASSVTIRMVANCFRKFPLTGVTITRPTADQRANRPGGANSAWSRYHIEAGAYLPLHPFFVGVANYFGVAPFQITPNGYRMLAALYVLYKLNKWPEPSPHEVNYLFDLKSNPQHNGTGFFHFCHQETGRTFLSGTTHISNVGHYNKEYFFTPDIASNNLAFARGGKNLSFAGQYFSPEYTLSFFLKLDLFFRPLVTSDPNTRHGVEVQCTGQDDGRGKKRQVPGH